MWAPWRGLSGLTWCNTTSFSDLSVMITGDRAAQASYIDPAISGEPSCRKILMCPYILYY
jgi:hypothetical protein